MFTPQQLLLLPLNKRAQYIWDYGRFIGVATFKDFPSNGYGLGDYYAAVLYNNVENRIEDIICLRGFYNN